MSPQASDILITAGIIAALFGSTTLAVIIGKLCVRSILIAVGRRPIKSFWSFALTEVLIYAAVIGFVVGAFILPPLRVNH
jgi:hypothetical protein